MPTPNLRPFRGKGPSGPDDIPERVMERVRTHVDPESGTGCINSRYSTASHGYAQVGWHTAHGARVGTLCHRVAWVAATGRAIPDGYTIDHTCKNRICVNPDHLRLLPNFENARRTSGRDWPLGECVNGHSNDLLIKRGKKWRCSKCREDWLARSNERKRLGLAGKEAA